MEYEKRTRYLRKLSERGQTVTLSAIRKNSRTNGTKLRKKLLENCNLVFSFRTMDRTFKEHRYFFRVVVKNEISETYEFKEKELALLYKDDDVSLWKQVIFGDLRQYKVPHQRRRVDGVCVFAGL